MQTDTGGMQLVAYHVQLSVQTDKDSQLNFSAERWLDKEEDSTYTHVLSHRSVDEVYSSLCFLYTATSGGLSTTKYLAIGCMFVLSLPCRMYRIIRRSTRRAVFEFTEREIVHEH